MTTQPIRPVPTPALFATRPARVTEPTRAPAQSSAPAPVPTPAVLAARPAPPPQRRLSSVTAPACEGDDVRFTPASRSDLKRFGLTEGDVAVLVAVPDIVTPDENPAQGRESREIRYGGNHGFVCSIDDYTDRDIVWVLGVIPRNHGDGQSPESLREVSRPQPRYAGAGNATGTMPTSFEEIIERVEAAPGWDIEEGRGKHPRHIVSADGRHRQPIPSSASDYRSIRNAVAQLRGMGLDVRRPPGGAR